MLERTFGNDSYWQVMTEFSAADIRMRAQNELPKDFSAVGEMARPESERSDYDVDEKNKPADFLTSEFRQAAVLVPIIERSASTTVLLTQRSHELPTHAGQISFPGGKIEVYDQTPLDTAYRETEEEIGLDRQHVEFVGVLDKYRTGTGFLITPILGIVKPDFDLSLDHNEVAEVFEVPLSFLMTADNHELHQREIMGRHRTFYAMPYEDKYIWGATAGILRNLFERLYV